MLFDYKRLFPCCFLTPLSPSLSVINCRSSMILQRTTCTWVRESLHANRAVRALDLVVQVTRAGTRGQYQEETCTNLSRGISSEQLNTCKGS